MRKTERQDTHGARALHPRRSGLWLARLPKLPHLALQLPHTVLDLGGAVQLLRGQKRPHLKGDRSEERRVGKECSSGRFHDEEEEKEHCTLGDNRGRETW